MKKKKSKKKTSFISKTAMTVLTIILIILFFCIMSMVEKIQGTARVVNYAGLVRGKTQRIIKLEDAGEPQDTMIADINAYIDGLQNGSIELDLVRGSAKLVRKVFRQEIPVEVVSSFRR